MVFKITDTEHQTVPKVTEELLSNIVSKIVKHFHPHKIILFGSQVWGEPTDYSDVDILVILNVEGSLVRKAAEIAMIARPKFLPMDIIVRTPHYIKNRIKVQDPFIKKIINSGRVLYEGRTG